MTLPFHGHILGGLSINPLAERETKGAACMNYMANKLGAWQAGGDETKGKVEFKIFFPEGFDPQVVSIKVAGDFQSQISPNPDWDFPNGFPLTSADSPEGTIWSACTPKELTAGYYQYKYFVTFKDGSSRIVSDPCTRYGGTENQNAAFVIGGSSPADNTINPVAGGRKPLRDLVIYEMMIDDFTSEYIEDRAPLDAVIGKLDYLKELGFNAILFMPWTAWKNRDFDWGYEPFQYFAVEYRYANAWGKPAEKISWLKKLVNACHERGIHVIMDGVFNHVSMDFPYKALYLEAKDCPFAGDFGGTFFGLQDLNFNNECTNEFILDVCRYWMDTFKIDGIRFDNTVNFYVAGDANGLPRLLADIQAHVAAKREANFSLTLEHIDMSAVKLTNDTKADSYWDNALYGCTFDALWNNRVGPTLLNALNNQRFLNCVEKVPTIYCSNHDHSHICWQAGARSNEGAGRWYRVQPFIIALYTATGAPMVQNGQEFGEDHWIPENDGGTGRRVAPRPLRWKMTNDPIGKAMMNLHRRLGEIRLQYAGLRSANFYPQPWDEWQMQLNPEGYGLDVFKQVAVYHRWGNDDKKGNTQKFIIVLNFSDSPQEVSVPFPENGVWTDLLSGYCGDWKPIVDNWRLNFTVAPNWGHVFFK
jgi:pullulanase